MVSTLVLDFGNFNPNFYKECKKEILEVFNRDDFFDVSVKNLTIWSKIIDSFLDNTKVDILTDYLLNVNFSSFFGSRNHEFKKRIKSFQRVCFIVYCGENEKYMDQSTLKQLFRKIKAVLSDD